MIRALIFGAWALAATPAPYTARQHNAHVAGTYDVWIAVESSYGSPLLNHAIVSPDEAQCNQRARAMASARNPHVTCVRASIIVPRR